MKRIFFGAAALIFLGPMALAQSKWDSGTVGAYNWTNTAKWYQSDGTTPLGYVPGTPGHTTDEVTLNWAAVANGTVTIEIAQDLTVANWYAAMNPVSSTTVFNQSSGTVLTVINRPGKNLSLTLQGAAAGATSAENLPVITYNCEGQIVIDGSWDSGNASLALRALNGQEGIITMNLLGNNAALSVRDADAQDGQISFWNTTGPEGSYTLALHAQAQVSAESMLLIGEYANLAFADSYGDDTGFGNIAVSGNVEFQMNDDLWRKTDLELTLGAFTATGTYELVSVGGNWVDNSNSDAVIDPADYGTMFRRVIINGTEYVSADIFGTEFAAAGYRYRLDIDADSIDITVLKPALSVAAVFDDNMVLQRDMDAPIWGWGAPGETVTVKVDGSVVSTTVVNGQGEWMAHCGSHAHDGGLPHAVSVEHDGQTNTFTNVVFGDVWHACGQSNMGYKTSQADGYSQELLTADYPLIRLLQPTLEISSEPCEDANIYRLWESCSADTLSYFSAVAYYYAKEIFLQTGVPIGILQTAWGGKKLERFYAPSGVKAVPEMAGLLQYIDEQNPVDPNSSYDIYNAMIHPLIPYGIRGSIWYQGESNAGSDARYYYNMLALMRGWRIEWGQGDWPFYYVQLPNYGNTDSDWPGLREAQFFALNETNSGMIVTIDVGESMEIHPGNKTDVGIRLAQWPLAQLHGLNVPYSGPLFYNAQAEGDTMRVFFDHADGGLLVGTKEGMNPVVETAGPLQNFEIAGADTNYVAAIAWIEKDTVVVSNAMISSPQFVRYCYSNDPSGTNKLYGISGLPASPFRTDSEFRVDVLVGTGTDNSVLAGETVAIDAGTAPSGQVFDRWIGTASEVADINSASTTLTVSDTAVFVYPAFRDSGESTWTVTVNNGAGDGSSRAGSSILIAADAPTEGMQFDRWSGNTNLLCDVASAKTTFVMPGSNVTFTALYKTAEKPDDGSGVMLGSPDASDGMFTFGFTGDAGRRYRVERSDSLSSPDWQTVWYSVFSDGTSKTVNCGSADEPQGFLRLIVE